ncbi:MAG: hypothetical protein PHF46_00985 [Candidatus Gracilibacteria bacterium]|nr:hypothetical protein [Candidatus Gracilibacteria bacterium]MDD4531027.1 hypothetical protein [Candidatus Gracilibacteria bacterium]
MSYIEGEGYDIIKKHYIMLVYTFAKFLFLSAITGVIFYICFKYKNDVPDNIKYTLIIPVIVALLNYSFLKLLFGLIYYNNNLIVILKDKIYIIHSTLILKDDVEMMDMYKVMKVDVLCHGLLSNVLKYGHLLIEQQTNDARTLHFIPDPFEALEKLKHRIDNIRVDKYTGKMERPEERKKN